MHVTTTCVLCLLCFDLLWFPVTFAQVFCSSCIHFIIITSHCWMIHQRAENCILKTYFVGQHIVHAWSITYLFLYSHLLIVVLLLWLTISVWMWNVEYVWKTLGLWDERLRAEGWWLSYAKKIIIRAIIREPSQIMWNIQPMQPLSCTVVQCTVYRLQGCDINTVYGTIQIMSIQYCFTIIQGRTDDSKQRKTLQRSRTKNRNMFSAGLSCVVFACELKAKSKTQEPQT